MSREAAQRLMKGNAVASGRRVIVSPETASNSKLPPWVREGRAPTREELAARHLQCTPAAVPERRPHSEVDAFYAEFDEPAEPVRVRRFNK
jgi:hypothetical protein